MPPSAWYRPAWHRRGTGLRPVTCDSPTLLPGACITQPPGAPPHTTQVIACRDLVEGALQPHPTQDSTPMAVVTTVRTPDSKATDVQ